MTGNVIPTIKDNTLNSFPVNAQIVNALSRCKKNDPVKIHRTY
jgi:hypothetical protein